MNETPALESEGRPSAWSWHLYLLFRPTTFFRAFGSNQVPLLTAACAWMFGAARVIDRAETTAMRGRQFVVPLDDWVTYWIAVLSLGVVVGALTYVIGGWWYRVRVRWSGDPDSDPATVKRVYLFSSQIVALPTLLATMRESSWFGTPLEAIQDEGSLWYALLLPFPLWSMICGFVGVRTMFHVSKLRALMWFVVLPATFTYIAVALVLGALLFQDPDLDNPSHYEDEWMSFDYPGNWWVEGDGASVQLEGAPDAFVRLMRYSSDRTLEQELAASLDGFKEAGAWAAGAPFTTWFGMEGVGSMGTFAIDGSELELRIFATDLGGDYFEYQSLIREDERDVVRPVVELLERTLELR